MPRQNSTADFMFFLRKINLLNSNEFITSVEL